MSLDGEVPDQRVVERSADARKSRIVAPSERQEVARIVLFELCRGPLSENVSPRDSHNLPCAQSHRVNRFGLPRPLSSRSGGRRYVRIRCPPKGSILPSRREPARSTHRSLRGHSGARRPMPGLGERPSESDPCSPRRWPDFPLSTWPGCSGLRSWPCPGCIPTLPLPANPSAEGEEHKRRRNPLLPRPQVMRSPSS